MNRRGSLGVTLALAAAVATACRVTPATSPSTPGPPAVAPSAAVTPVTAPPVGVTAPSGGNLVQLNGLARSVETTAPATGLGSVHLAGAPVLTVSSADIVDVAGRDLGAGTLTGRGSDVVVSGTGLTLAGTLRIQPSAVTVNGATVTVPANGVIDAGGFTFQAPTPTPPAGRPMASPSAPPPVTVNGPVTIKGAGASAAISGPALRWVDAPADVAVSSSEADLSWAGSGTITTAGGPLTARFLGVRAQQLSVVLHRAGGQVGVQGTGLALQAFADGIPQIRTPARMDILRTGATTGSFFSLKPAFVWTPRNLGSTYDMAILSIRPVNAAASGVHLSLRAMPPMFGGEPHALVGGDTSGLKSGDAIDSLIARNGDDKRSIGYDAPAHATLVLIVQGNFDPISVTVQTP